MLLTLVYGSCENKTEMSLVGLRHGQMYALVMGTSDCRDIDRSRNCLFTVSLNKARASKLKYPKIMIAELGSVVLVMFFN